MAQISNSQVKILVIDDDRIIQLVLKQTLQAQGYEVILASSGAQGLEQAYKYHPAMIISDWQMDEMDGLEVCRKIKSEPSLSTTFFILLTSRKAVEDRVEGLDTGADDFLSKPIEVNELKARVRAGLRLYQMNQELQKLAQDLQIQKHLLETELNEAADYVKSILPKPISGLVTINSRFLPCHQLGGDCFDYYWLDEDNLVIYLLDVSGHGLAAALPSISIHNLLRSQSLPQASLYNPSEVFQSLNNVFKMEQQNYQYFTIWYGVFNRKSSQLTYASAGHPPALLLSLATDSELQVKQLITRSLPIGVYATNEYYNEICDIEAGSKLYVFSDGVFEVEKSDGSLWDLNSFINLLTGCNQSSQTDLDSILEKIKNVTGSKIFTDDCSLLEISFGIE
ncbi:SpoIIE family protein phosphatase [Nostoc sp. UCD121]|uniref:PP2C family protein-serine/threonine phosphatase n=1 Tax=unclassified Nostoc TaxID=2593658 RepID=UPI00162882A7|nr:MULTISPECIES: SpoIIE family protein phosphatase [unclassified Nostoc]MBC1218666.1 SpoIIE family protein phosphatase [Nostoc sp. UCD120]MBC1276352.1 SpoIIE family protein phosphatase [Nostoc sp. UCD121]MBC1295587.1 SpoIIE family protein phosphatase [Nostoc sp. UCD122]